MKWVEGQMRRWFDIKVRAVLGEDPEDDKEVTILGRIVRWTSSGIEFEADPKHRSLVMEMFGFIAVMNLMVRWAAEYHREKSGPTDP